MTKTRDISKILQGVTVDGNIVADQYIGTSVVVSTANIIGTATMATANITGTATMAAANPECMRITGGDDDGYAQFSFGSSSSPSDTGTHMINTASGLFQIKTGSPNQSLAQKRLEVDNQGNMDVTGNLTVLGNSVLAVVAESLQNTGYVELSNGLVIQWGRESLTSNNSQSITWPKAFNSTPFISFGVEVSNADANANISGGSPSATGWTNINPSAAGTYHWIAIGV